MGRQDGYYWVKVKDYPIWKIMYFMEGMTPAFYDNGVKYREQDLVKISQRIEEPRTAEEILKEIHANLPHSYE